MKLVLTPIRWLLELLMLFAGVLLLAVMYAGIAPLWLWEKCGGKFDPYWKR